jgi:tRNA pseudouridine55 synthase
VSASGFLLIDKPLGFTSHDVVAVVRRELGERRVGHAGTLDPAATGLLILGIGRSTRLLTFLVGADKEYEAVVRLGVSTKTDDAEGEVRQQRDVGNIGRPEIVAAAEQFRGAIEQRPSSVSAVKVAGKRAYQRVRAGESVELAKRSVMISELVVGDIAERVPARNGSDHRTIDVGIRTRVSSGTYVRALARDLGESLGCGGHLVQLRRTSVGPFDVGEAFTGLVTLADSKSRAGQTRGDCGEGRTAQELEDCDNLKDSILSPEIIASRAWPIVVLDAESAEAVKYGQRIPATGDDLGPIALCSDSGALLAMAEAESGLWRYRVVLGAPGPKTTSRVI